MTTEQKVALEREARAAYGLPPVLAALDLPRSTWYYHRSRPVDDAEKYRHLRGPLETIARQHPEYGYRRTTVEVREVYGLKVNHKVVQKLHRWWDLSLIRGTRRPKPSGIRQAIMVVDIAARAVGKRANLVSAMTKIRPFEVAYTDFTQLIYADGRGKAYLMAIVDHASKLVLGWAVGECAVTRLALRAWEKARQTLVRRGIPLAGMIVHHDQDPVFTGYGWTSRLLLENGVRVSYALNGAKDNTLMEAFFSRFKTENRSLLLDAQTMDQLTHLVTERMEYYNHERRHSSISYLSPAAYIETLQL